MVKNARKDKKKAAVEPDRAAATQAKPYDPFRNFIVIRTPLLIACAVAYALSVSAIIWLILKYWR